MTKGIIIIKSHHNNANQPVYDYFINFNDILCFIINQNWLTKIVINNII
jgi:hypothetical protein